MTELFALAFRPRKPVAEIARETSATGCQPLQSINNAALALFFSAFGKTQKTLLAGSGDFRFDSARIIAARLADSDSDDSR